MPTSDSQHSDSDRLSNVAHDNTDGNMFYLPGFEDRQDEFVPMTAQEVTAANAKHQNDLYRRMDEELPQQLAYFSESETDISAQEESLAKNVDGGRGKAKIYMDTDKNKSSRKVEDLEMLLDVRVREIKVLTESLDTLKETYRNETDQLRTELYKVSSEKRQTALSLDEARKLIASNEIEWKKLHDELTELRNQNEKLACELEVANLTCKDLQKNILFMEKGSRDKMEWAHMEKKLLENDEKHLKEVKQIEEELKESAKKCKKLEMENLDLVTKLRQLTKSNEELLAERAENMCKFSKEVDRLKDQLSGGSVMQLQLDLARKEAREAELESQIRELQRRCDDYTDELRLLKVSVPCQINTNANSTSAMLNNELLRVCAEAKNQRAEIAKLQLALREKELALSNQATELIKAKHVVSERERQIEKLEARLKEELTSRVEDVNVSLSDDQKVTEMNEENDRLKKQLALLQQQVQQMSKEASQQVSTETLARYNEEYLRFHEEKMEELKNELEAQYKLDLQTRECIIENLREEIKETQNSYFKLKEFKQKEIQSKEDDILKLQKELAISKIQLEAANELSVTQLQKELEASKERVLELSKLVSEHCNDNIFQLKESIKKLTNENKDLLEKVKQSEAASLETCQKNKELEEAVSSLQENIAKTGNSYEEERKRLGEEYERKSKMLESELQIKLAEVEAKLKCMEEQSALNAKSFVNVATSPIRQRYLSEEDFKKRICLLAEIHGKEFRDLELQYSLALAKYVQDFKSSQASNAQTSDVATNTEQSLIRGDTNESDQAWRMQYKMALNAALQECDDLRRQLLEKEVTTSSEVHKMSEKLALNKKKVQQYKEYFHNALKKLQQEHDRYNRTLAEIQRDINSLRKFRPEIQATSDAIVQIYEEKIDSIRQNLEHYSRKKSQN